MPRSYQAEALKGEWNNKLEIENKFRRFRWGYVLRFIRARYKDFNAFLIYALDLGEEAVKNHQGKYVVQKKTPSYLYIHLTSFPSNQSFQKFLQKISPKDSKMQLLISGGITDSYKYSLPQNVNFLKSFPEVLTYIQSL